MEAIETLESRGITGRLFVDGDPMSPYEWTDDPTPRELAQYDIGDVYGYVIEDGGEHIDSCWGFYGYEYALSQLSEAFAYAVSGRHQARHELYRSLVGAA